MALRRRLPLIRLTVAVLALAACAAGCGSSSRPSAATTTAARTTTSATLTFTQATTTTIGPHCASHAAPHLAPRTEPRPKTALDPKKHYVVTFRTNCGTFAVGLAVATSPHVTASFADLVRRHYFDGTAFHRIIPGFVAQAGDPTGTGTSGPGYTTVDAPPATTEYTPGVVAMAKTQTQPAGTSGSQFFIVTGSQAASLTPDYAVLGHVVSGMKVVDEIGGLGDPSGAPTALVVIDHATLSVR